MEVKQNNTNGQKYVTIPKDSPLKPGDKVNVTKKRETSLGDLDVYYTNNGEKLKRIQEDLRNYWQTYHIAPIGQFIKYFEEKHNIQYEVNDLGIGIVRGNTEVYLSADYDVEDYNNFINFNDFDDNDFEAFKEVDGDVEGFIFDEDHCKDKIEDSMVICTFIQILEKRDKEYQKYEDDSLSLFGFKSYDWGGNIGLGEDESVYYNEEENVYLAVGGFIDSKYLKLVIPHDNDVFIEI